MIEEKTIERVLARLESGTENYERGIREFTDAQPFLMNYLTQEDIAAFTEAERELLLFAALVIYQSVEEQRSGDRVVENEAIAAAEEENYELMGSGRGEFRDRLTLFFEQSAEEELLAFAEDLTLDDDPESEISREAREPFFVTLKTVVDVLTAG